MSEDKLSRSVTIGLGVVIAFVLLIVVGFTSFSRRDVAYAQEITRQPVSTAGTNPFMPAVGTDKPVTPPKKTGGTYTGDTPGLYGGTQKKGACNPRQIVTYLQANPDKESAWADAIGIHTDQISAYVRSLTSVVLRSDTAVTNHGYKNGELTEFQSVLQAGTAVLVDKYGTPVTKCFCGNPLAKPLHYLHPTYTGSSWTYFAPARITVIQQSNVVISQYTFVNVDATNNNTTNTYTYDPPPAPPLVNYPHPDPSKYTPPPTDPPTTDKPSTPAPGPSETGTVPAPVPSETGTVPAPVSSDSGAPLPSDSGSALASSDSATSLSPLETLSQNWDSLSVASQQSTCNNVNTQGADAAANTFLSQYPVQGIAQADLAQFLTSKCPAPATSDTSPLPSDSVPVPAAS